MPTLTYTNPTLSNPSDKSEIEANFADASSLLNGNLANDNLSASAGIATSKLAARDYEFLATFRASSEYTGAAFAAPATSATRPAACVSLPGSTTDGVAYTVLSGAYLIRGGGTAANTTFEIQLGYFNAGVWTQIGSDIVTTTNIAGGTEDQSGALTITTASITLHASTQYHLGLFLTATATNALDAQGEYLSATLKLRRTSGLRGT